MSLELHEIPPTPRRASWRSVCAVGWPLLLGGLFLTVYGGLVTLMLFFASHADTARIEIELDERGVTTTGTVTATEPLGRVGARPPIDRAEFRFRAPDGQEVLTACFVPRGRFATGAAVTVEHLPEPPWHARLAGGHFSYVSGFVGPAFWATVVPGLLLIAVWFCCVRRTRQLLTHGDAAPADVIGVARLRFVLPAMLAVRFRFRDRHAQFREGRHWVRERSALGQRLVDGATQIVVIHDREHPSRYRLAQRGDFDLRAAVSTELSNYAGHG